MKNTRKGFTLVELLAVIVILAIIMIIAIPAVLSTMQTAKQKTFVEYVTKVYTAAQNKYMEQKATGATLPAVSDPTNQIKKGSQAYVCYDYNITNDLGLTSTGEYKGHVVICETNSASTAGVEILVQLADKEFYTFAATDAGYLWNYTSANAPKAEDIKLGNKASDTATAPTIAQINAALAQTRA